MQRVAIHGPNDVRLEAFDEPQAGPDDIVVRVAAPGICGGDVSYARRGELDAGPLVSHRFSFSEFPAAFEVAKDREASAKVMITFP